MSIQRGPFHLYIARCRSFPSPISVGVVSKSESADSEPIPWTLNLPRMHGNPPRRKVSKVVRVNIAYEFLNNKFALKVTLSRPKATGALRP